jgi:hypothetical protein
MGSRTAQGVLVVAAVALSGCAGARYEVRADSSAYPISLSPVLPDADGTLLYLGHGLEQLGTFTHNVSKLGVFYGATTGTLDISELVNREVSSRSGDGVVSLTLTNEHCALNWFFPLTLLPFYPGCEDVTVTGLVVRARRPAAPPPAAPPAPASPPAPEVRP